MLPRGCCVLPEMGQPCGAPDKHIASAVEVIDISSRLYRTVDRFRCSIWKAAQPQDLGQKREAGRPLILPEAEGERPMLFRIVQRKRPLNMLSTGLQISKMRARKSENPVPDDFQGWSCLVFSMGEKLLCKLAPLRPLGAAYRVGPLTVQDRNKLLLAAAKARAKFERSRVGGTSLQSAVAFRSDERHTESGLQLQLKFIAPARFRH
jgi:hypothetical protein